MALIKSIDIGNTGSPATYWRILSRSDSYDAQTTTLVLAGYADKAARAAGRNPVTQQMFQMTLADFPEQKTFHNITGGEIYTALTTKGKVKQKADDEAMAAYVEAAAKVAAGDTTVIIPPRPLPMTSPDIVTLLAGAPSD